MSSGEHEEPGCAPDPGAASRSPVTGWQRYARLVGLLILVVVSIYGIREFMAGDAASVTEVWSKKLVLLPVVFVLAAVDVALETVAWIWIYQRFRLKATDFAGACVCVAGKAGNLLPAQLGRLIRPDAMVRLGRGSVEHCLKAEGAVFVLDALSVVALLATLAAFRIHPLLAPVAWISLVGFCLLLGNRIARLVAGTRLEVPPGFWWSWQSAAIVAVEALGWIAHGLAFWVLVRDLPGHFGVWDSLFLAPGSAVLGVGSGLPGGLGATEGALGASLKFNEVPGAHFAMVVAAFRVVTFWIWIPIGWAALAFTRRRARTDAAEREAREETGTGGEVAAEAEGC